MCFRMITISSLKLHYSYIFSRFAFPRSFSGFLRFLLFYGKSSSSAVVWIMNRDLFVSKNYTFEQEKLRNDGKFSRLVGSPLKMAVLIKNWFKKFNYNLNSFLKTKIPNITSKSRYRQTIHNHKSHPLFIYLWICLMLFCHCWRIYCCESSFDTVLLCCCFKTLLFCLFCCCWWFKIPIYIIMTTQKKAAQKIQQFIHSAVSAVARYARCLWGMSCEKFINLLFDDEHTKSTEKKQEYWESVQYRITHLCM